MVVAISVGNMNMKQIEPKLQASGKVAHFVDASYKNGILTFVLFDDMKEVIGAGDLVWDGEGDAVDQAISNIGAIAKIEKDGGHN